MGSAATRPVTALVVAVVAALALGAVVVARLDPATGGAVTVSRFEQAAEVSALPGEIGIREGWNRSAFTIALVLRKSAVLRTFGVI